MTTTIAVNGPQPLSTKSIFVRTSRGPQEGGHFWYHSPFYQAINVNLNNCTGILEKSINISTTTIHNSYDYLFRNCTKLQSATNFNPNITSFSNAFYNCTNLTTISAIPNSVTNLADAFYYCLNLTTTPVIPAGEQTVTVGSTASTQYYLSSGSGRQLAALGVNTCTLNFVSDTQVTSSYSGSPTNLTLPLVFQWWNKDK